MANDYPGWMEDDNQSNDSGDLGSWGDSSDDMTYDEWERQQEEAAKPPPPPSPEIDEVPDWFHNIDGQAAAPASIDGGSVMSDYVPEWFMGVEELSVDDAPDWLKESQPTGTTPQQPGAAPPAQAPPEVTDEDAFLDSILMDEEPPAQAAPVDDAPLEMDFLADDDDDDDDDAPLEMDFLADDDDDAPIDLGLMDDDEPETVAEAPVAMDFLLGDDDSADDAPLEMDFLADDDDDAPLDLGLMDDDEAEGLADAALLELDSLDDDAPVDLGFADEDEAEAGALDLDFLDDEPEVLGLADEDEAEAGALDLDFLDDAPGILGLPDDGEAKAGSLDTDFLDAEITSQSLADEDEAEAGALDLDFLDAEIADLSLADEGEPDVLAEAAPLDLDFLDDTPADLGLADEAEGDLLGAAELTGDTGWLDDLDFSGMQESAPEAGSPEPLASGREIGTSSLDIDNLLGSEDIALPSGETGLDAGEVQLDALDSLSFDDEFLSDFPTTVVEEDEDDLEVADLEPADIDEDLLEMPDMDIEISEDMPEWMSQAVVSEETVALHIAGIETEYDQVPDITLPAELRAIRENITGRLKQAKSEEETPNSGPLAGIEGAIHFDPKMAEFDLLASSGLTDAQEEHLASLQRVLRNIKEEATQALEAEVGEKVEETVSLPERLLQSIHWERLLVTIILLVVVVLPIVTDGLHLADDPPTALDDQALVLAAAVDGLVSPAASGDVLFAFEYAPQASGELDPLVGSVLRDVLINGGRPVILSSSATGTLNAQSVLKTLAKDQALLDAMGREEPLRSPGDYILLRYLPGGAVGVRALASFESFSSPFFAADLRGHQTGLAPGPLDHEDFAFVVVVGERVEDIRIWSEQFGDTGIPMFALVTASAEPVTRVYVSSGRYQGMLAGIRGTLTYTGTREIPLTAPDEDSKLPDALISRWHSTALGALMAAIIIGGGSLLGFILNLRRRR